MPKTKKTVVIGASSNPQRYAYLATVKLHEKGHEVVPVGLKEGKIEGINVLDDFPKIENVDTVTLYVAPRHQAYWKDYIFSLRPKRVIFNPGAESDFEKELEAKGIETIEACTLVLLSTGQF